ncbi:MAG: PIN domain-containing protein [Spirochaetes bacterium]|nr:PIN domain-containing protein [Spirochaetota bacterium]
MNKVFLDSDVILDLLLNREPDVQFIEQLFTKIEVGDIEGYTSSLVFSNVYYVLRKYTNHEKAMSGIKKLQQIIRILNVGKNEICSASESDFNDFEDAIQIYTAKNNKIKVIITRNKQDYKKSDLIIMNAEEYIKSAV